MKSIITIYTDIRVKDGVIEHQQDKIYELAFSYAEGKGQVIFRACDHP